MAGKPKIKIYFSEYFEIDAAVLHGYGAFNVSLINDLPLFIDPFLLFNSSDSRHRALHDEVIKYVQFLRDKARTGVLNPGLLKAWFTFPEVKQTWLGFSKFGNSGSGLGSKFANALNRNLNHVFVSFGEDPISKGSHLEKLCLIEDGVGRDNISDFTTNLIKGFLLQFTQEFAQKYLREDQRKRFNVDKVTFNYQTETWESGVFDLPCLDGDYVILTPRDILTKDDTWINRDDLLGNLDEIKDAVTDDQLRAQFENYISRKLFEAAGKKEPTDKQKREALADALREFPTLLDYYIRWKEDRGDEAETVSSERVTESETLFIQGVQKVVEKLVAAGFYDITPNTLEEARKRVQFLKSVIEDQDGYRWFLDKDDKPIRREEDLQILFRLTWFATPSDVNREVNNGRGSVDFKVSRGAIDKSLIEFKLASNKKLKQNLQNQVEIYERANDTKKSLKVIIYFTKEELDKVTRVLEELKLDKDSDIILIDGRCDNKPSASNAK